MESGDGWIVRVSPPGGRLTAGQAAGLAAAAQQYGNGWLDLTSRGNVQVRGVTDHPGLLDALADLRLLPDAGRDLPGILVTPFWTEGDGVQDTAAALTAALSAAALPLPAKFGFVIDAGGALAAASADIRIEVAAEGGLTVRPGGQAEGRSLPDAKAAVGAALALARAYLAQTAGMKRPPRMRDLPSGPFPATGRAGDAPGVLAVPGPTAQGMLVALAFGQLSAETLATLGPLRLTPWRMVLCEGRRPGDPGLAGAGLITDPADPLLRVVACPGAPACPQAHAATRGLARALAPRVPAGRTLHVSGCAKGCAHPRTADITLTARAGGWDLTRHARAGDPPLCSLSTAELEDPDAACL
jgi:precorrin-3B synthase